LREILSVTERAYFGGGCFWNAERIFYSTKGVIETEVGFCRPEGKGFLSRIADVEVVRVDYDPEVVSYEKLIDIFWTTHNPLNPVNKRVSNGERSVLFYENELQKEVAEEELAKHDSYHTSVESFKSYKTASKKDQKYYMK